ncbi:methyltransferase domain-containing protein [Acidobacteria bacterium AH-259-A15]|nr:methyltransferase domain-containing protein [Acidobacteria bacterium AH-259-A15]
MQELLREIAICPNCNNGSLEWTNSRVRCEQCGSDFRVQKGIPYFLEQGSYWCNLPQTKMAEIIAYVEKHGFQAALRDRIPRYLHENFSLPGRADAKFFLPLHSESLIIDLGCMWGSLTLPLAEQCRHVLGVDQTLETLLLNYYRAKELCQDNIAFMGGDIRRLPVRSACADVAVMNGVLEWLGSETEYVVEQFWGKRAAGKGNNFGSKSPRELQLEGLMEALRILKPGGILYLAIENRFGLPYWLGSPDDHSGLRFNSLLPRGLANLYSRLAIRQPYRAYTYSARALRKLLTEAGFNELEFLTAYDTYRKPSTIFALENDFLRFYYENHLRTKSSRKGRAVYCMLLRSTLARLAVQNFLVLCRKPGDRAGTCTSSGSSGGFLQVILSHWEQILGSVPLPEKVQLMKFNSRMEQAAAVSFLVFDDRCKTEPVGFLKVNRDAMGFKRVEREGQIYQSIYERTRNSRRALAKQIYSGALHQTFFISRLPLKGHFLERTLFPERNKPKNRRKLAKFCQLAIEWLIDFNSDTCYKNVSFDTFWHRFFVKRLETFETHFHFCLSTNAIERYRNRLSTLLEGADIQVGPIHGDYNLYNILTTSEGVYVVDWEHAELESVPLFDALNLFFEMAVQIKCVEPDFDLTKLCVTEQGDSFLSIMDGLLAKYAASQNASLHFMKACSPIFILDLLHRDYGDHTFSLRSPQVFKQLFDAGRDTA